MKDSRTLMHLEYEWRLFRNYSIFINWLVKRKIKLSSPILCMLKKKLEKHGFSVTKLKALYEEQTGQVVVFYNYNDN
ncbi:MAG: hypothetical protein ACYDEX_24170 [Mobilitalea sp.]